MYGDIMRYAYGHLLTAPGDIFARLKQLDNTISNKLSLTDIKNYLIEIINTKYDFSQFYGKDLSLINCYVNHNCMLLSFDQWKASDDYLLQNNKNEITNGIELIKTKLDSETFILIGSHFGIGKSTFAKMLSIIYAIDFLKNLENPGIKLFPIYINLKNGMCLEYKSFNIKTLINLLPHNKTINPILILDGLDELTNIENLHEEIEILRGSSPNLKVIITSRIQDDILEKHGYCHFLKHNLIYFVKN